MARNFDIIYDEIIAEKDSLATLSGLTPTGDSFADLLSDLSSGSKVAIWRLWVWLIAFAIWSFENVMDLFEARVEAIAAAAQPQTEQWFQKKMLEFQYPDALVIIDNVPKYSAVDLTKRIIKRAAVVGTQFKAAKLSGSAIVPLDVAEAAALDSYIRAVGFPGLNPQIISRDSDLLKVAGEIFFNAQLDAANIQTLVEAAITKHCNDLSNYDFNGKLYLQKLTDAIQAVPGVIDVRIDSLEAKAAAAVYASVLDVYQTNAGHIKPDPDSPNTLAETLTYTPTNV